MALRAAVQRVCVVQVSFHAAIKKMHGANIWWRAAFPGLFLSLTDTNSRLVAVKKKKKTPERKEMCRRVKQHQLVFLLLSILAF